MNHSMKCDRCGKKISKKDFHDEKAGECLICGKTLCADCAGSWSAEVCEVCRDVYGIDAYKDHLR